MKQLQQERNTLKKEQLQRGSGGSKLVEKENSDSNEGSFVSAKDAFKDDLTPRQLPVPAITGRRHSAYVRGNQNRRALADQQSAAGNPEDCKQQ